LGYNFRGSVNVPLSDTFAIRVSGFTRQDPGYVDNVLTGQHGINKGENEGGRLSALWRPSQDVSLKLSALYQHSKTDGSSEVGSQIGAAPSLGDLQQSNVKGTGGYDRKFQVYSAKLVAKIGAAELTSISGYSVNTFHDSVDITTFFGSLNQAQFGVSGAPLIDDNETKKFSQEIRLAMPLSRKIDWQFGLFYTDERSSYVQSIPAAVPATGAVVGIGLTESFPTTYQEYAAFTDLTFHITDQFDIQAGGRESRNRQTYTELDTGPLVPVTFGFPSPLVFPLLVTNESAFTYLLTPRFKLSPDLMVYARLASGFRPGGPNAEASAFGLPLSFNPDKTTSYELGVKGDAFGHTLSFDGSIYYIDWKAIQLTIVAPNGFSFFANGSRAKSQGVELSVTAKPLTGLTIAGWAEFNDAVLTEALPANGPTYGAPGDRLPYSSRFSGNVSIEQQFPITAQVSGFVGATESYVGAREDLFSGSAQRQNLPAYAKTDLRAGAKYELWTASLFVTNATDKRGILTGGLGTNIPYGFEYITPRTIGLWLSRNF
jgi:outer membrane receptor protein involved in Fe transport